MNTTLSKEEWEAKQEVLTKKTCEYTSLIRQISIAYSHGSKATKLLQKKKELWSEIQSLSKELGYPSHEDDLER